ncbi:MAG TPA: ATP-binding cassette domain-containing protein, partial [Trueperaceae bacterium]
MELLSFCDVSLFREGRSVLSAVSFTLNSGQKLGLIGANGAGKSTLLRIAAGRLSPDEGRVRRAPGLRFGYVGPASADFGPGTVQDALRRSQHHLLQLEDSLRHEERRLAAGEDRLEAYGELMQQFEMAGGYRADAHLEEALAALRLGPELRHRPLAALSGGERARLRLVVALAKGPELLLLDEPSNHLDIGM